MDTAKAPGNREWTSGDRVEHAHRLRSYGAGVITEILPFDRRPPALAKVRFDGETADRLIWVDDLTLIEPAPKVAPKVIWSPERAT